MFVRVVEDEVTQFNSYHEADEAKEVGTKNGASIELTHFRWFYFAHYPYYKYNNIMTRKFTIQIIMFVEQIVLLISVKELLFSILLYIQENTHRLKTTIGDI